MIFPELMSSLMTSTNSFRPSPMAPLSASWRSWARRASDSMMRSSTASWAIFAAFRVADWSNARTFDATVTVGIVGRIHSCADAGAGPEFPGGGRAAPAELETQLPMAGPAPTECAGGGGGGARRTRAPAADGGPGANGQRERWRRPIGEPRGRLRGVGR